jgi:hypothetical protein
MPEPEDFEELDSCEDRDGDPETPDEDLPASSGGVD